MQQPGLLEDVLAHGARVNGIRTWSLRGGEPSVVLDVWSTLGLTLGCTGEAWADLGVGWACPGASLRRGVERGWRRRGPQARSRKGLASARAAAWGLVAVGGCAEGGAAAAEAAPASVRPAEGA